MNFSVVIPPFFTGGGIPLGLTCIKTAVEKSGHRVKCFDIERALFLSDFDLLKSFSSLLYKSYPNVVFTLRPDLLVTHLFGLGKRARPSSIKDYELKIINEVAFYIKRWVPRILSSSPCGVLISTYSSNFWGSLFLAKCIKEISSSTIVVFGGPGCSLKECCNFSIGTGWVDFCVRGKGESAIVHLINTAFSPEAQSGYSISCRLNNEIIHFQGENGVCLDECRPDFEGLPWPGASLNLYQTYSERLVLPVTSSRGCMLKCRYCGETAFWEKFWYKKPRYVLDELMDLKQKWGSEYFVFYDSLINFNSGWLEELCDRLIVAESCFKFIFAFARPAGLDLGLLKKMYKAGFRRIFYGIDSGSNRVLRFLRKGTNVDKILQIVEWSLEANIGVGANIISGFPNETDEDFLLNLKLAKELFQIKNSRAEFKKLLALDTGHRFRLEAYSEFFRYPERFGIRIYEDPPRLSAHLKEYSWFINPLFQKWSSEREVKNLEEKLAVLRRFGGSFPLPENEIFWIMH